MAASPPFKRHFHTLDALRFFAFLKVFFAHSPGQYPYVIEFVKAGGSAAVQFFFVLSGFLITYLIIAEKKATGRFDLRRFLFRRTLRIWPLYYAIVAFAFLTPYLLSWLHLEHSNEGYEPNFWYTITFLENYVGIVRNEAPNVSPLGVVWSLCVEEHFYFIWGVTLCKLPARRLPGLILACIGLSLLARMVFVLAGWKTLDLLTNLDLFALGGGLAYLLVERRDWIEARIDWFPARAKIGCLGLVGAAAIIAPHLQHELATIVCPTVLGLLFAGALSLFLSSRSMFGLSEGNLFSKLGKYTYGMYLYHVIVLSLLTHVCGRAGFASQHPANGVFLSGLALSLTIGISVLSYRFFEKPLLSLKDRYSPI